MGLSFPVCRRVSVHLADREIVEEEGESRRHPGIGQLLVGDDDVETDGGRALLGGPAVARLHDARPAAGDHNRPAAADPAGARDHPREPAGGAIVVPPRVVRGRLVVIGGRAGRAEDHDRLVDARILEDELGFLVFEGEPDASELVAGKEGRIVIGQPVARRAGLGQPPAGPARMPAVLAGRGKGRTAAAILAPAPSG